MSNSILKPLCANCGSIDTAYYAKANDVEYFTSAKCFQYHHCNNCDVLFIDPMPVNELQIIYPSNYYSFTTNINGFSFKVKNYLDKLFFRKLFKQIHTPSLNVLDIGGGTGWLLDTIKSIDKRVVHTQIVDIDKIAATTAVENGHHYFCGTIETFETEKKYHVILLLNLIEHVANPGLVLEKANQLLAPGGFVIVKTPNYKSWDAMLFKDKHWGGYHCPRHWVIFNKQSFEALANKCNLTVSQFNYTQGAPFWTVSILHYLHKKRWLKASAQKPLIYHPLFGIISIITAAFDFLRKPFAPLSQMFFILTKK